MLHSIALGVVGACIGSQIVLSVITGAYPLALIGIGSFVSMIYVLGGGI